LVGSILKWF